MNVWVAAVIAMIVASALYSYHRQVSFSIVASVACVSSYALLLASSGLENYLDSATMYQLAFFPQDLTDPGRLYTALTSMYTHSSLRHLLFNVLGLAFIGMAFEQRIGTRPYILLFFITGLCGTLAFAALNWGEPSAAVVGASGAVFGVMAAFVRMFPYERMTLFPLPTMPLWVIVAGFLVLQILVLSTDSNVAVVAHIGGFAGGALLAPLIVRLPLHKRVRRMISQSALKRLATTPELKSIMRRIEEEEIPAVRSAWVEHFLTRATCPQCGGRLKARKDGVVCERGHMI